MSATLAITMDLNVAMENEIGEDDSVSSTAGLPLPKPGLSTSSTSGGIDTQDDPPVRKGSLTSVQVPKSPTGSVNTLRNHVRIWGNSDTEPGRWSVPTTAQKSCKITSLRARWSEYYPVA